MGRDKGCAWNPSTCECQCDTWCKPGQYLDHKSCVCKNKLIGRVNEECTSVINETMINNKDNITNNNNTYLILFIVFLIGFIVFLIGFTYYYRRSNFDKKISEVSFIQNYKNEYKLIRNKKQN